MTPKRLRKFRNVLDHRQPDLTVLMENVHKPHNLAAIARTCDAVGIPLVHAVSHYALAQLTQKSASGTGKWVNIHTHRTLEDAYTTLRRSGFHLLAAHFFPGARDFRDIDYRRPTAIVVGGERDGISERAVSGADDRIFIPMAGMVESLNVSVATALILFEAKRQRQRAGFYETPRLDKKTYQCLLFEWCYPRVAAYYRSQGLAYPRMNSYGDITEPVVEGGFRSDPCARCKEGGNRGP